MSIVKQSLVGASGQGGDYTINDSLRFRSSASAYLTRTFSTPTDNKKWTFSFWFKRGTLGTVQTILSPALSGNEDQIYFTGASDTFRFYIEGGAQGDAQTVAVFRDPSAWYHMIVVCDTANATATDRAIIYVNGVRQTVTGTNFSLNAVPDINGARLHNLGRYQSGAYYTDGYLTEINFIDGQALAPTDFGEYDANGTWKAKKYTGTYGTNGFYLNGVGVTDQSGNGNNWTNNNLNLSTSTATTYDQMKDTPSLVDEDAGNFCTWNPLRKGANVTVSEGNLKGITSATVAQSVAGTIGMSSGKWYWEVTNQGGSLSYTGIVDSTHDMGTYIGSSSTGSGYAYNTSGQKVGPTSGTVASYGASYTTNDVIGIALDMDAGTLTFYKNNASQGTAFSGITGTWFAAVSGNGVAGKGGIVNFGQRPFAYTPPTGFLKLNTFNLPDSTIEDGSDYFNAVLYTGDNTSNRNIPTGFPGGWTWIKNRNLANSHTLSDVVRGDGKTLFTNATNAEVDYGANGIDLVSDGFDVTHSASNNLFNVSGRTYVAWNWKANGSGSSNTDGSITSTVSVSTTSGFSIVTWTGTGVAATVGHGLGVAPDFIIFKNRTIASTWIVYSSAFASPGTQYLQFNSTLALQTDGTGQFFNSTAATSTVFSVKTNPDVNQNASNYVAYCFSEVEGYSKIGSYTGNGSADGPFIYTGFRPALVIFKLVTVADSWRMYDNKRLGYNANNNVLYPNLSNAEGSVTTHVDLLSNGFKLKSDNNNYNGGTHIYMAFAENPFKNANAR